MSLGYTRAYVERDSITDTSGVIRFIAATEGEKGDGVDLRMSGARLDRFRANPVVLFDHRYRGRDNLPIGRATAVEVAGERLMIDVTFDRADPFAAEVERKYRDGFLNAVSIGFEVHEFEDQKGKGGGFFFGGVATDWELLELSAVQVPMDADAVVSAGRRYSFDRNGAFTVAEFAEAVLAHIATASKPAEATPTEAEPSPEVAPEITPESAQALLAALTPKPAEENAV